MSFTSSKKRGLPEGRFSASPALVFLIPAVLTRIRGPRSDPGPHTITEGMICWNLLQDMREDHKNVPKAMINGGEICFLPADPERSYNSGKERRSVATWPPQASKPEFTERSTGPRERVYHNQRRSGPEGAGPLFRCFTSFLIFQLACPAFPGPDEASG